jgi:hypothetical protein
MEPEARVILLRIDTDAAPSICEVFSAGLNWLMRHQSKLFDVNPRLREQAKR